MLSSGPGWLLKTPLTWKWYGSGTVPESLKLVSSGTPYCDSSQNRRVFGLSTSQFLASRWPVDVPPNTEADRQRQLNPTSTPRYFCEFSVEFVSIWSTSPNTDRLML